jgi:hypothetical protein
VTVVTVGADDHTCSVKQNEVNNTVSNSKMKNLFVLKYGVFLITWKVEVFMSDHFNYTTNSSRTDFIEDSKIRKKVALPVKYGVRCSVFGRKTKDKREIKAKGERQKSITDY